jgi:hypothetical protein
MRFSIILGLATMAACDAGENKVAQSDGGAGNESHAAPLAPEKPKPAPVEPQAILDITMPEFAPQYPGSTIRAVNSSAAQRNVHEVTLETQDDAASIMAFYREKFSAGGLKKTSDFQSGGTGVLSAAAKNRKASIAITKGSASNSVIVTYSGE